jgi:ElaB/YqjD/DUF883 family membrane-anchored ribosome-binding protein
MPAATPSPWSSLSEKPVSASSAWPKVWPRLSKRALAGGLALVLADDAGLGGDRVGDRIFARGGIAGEQRRGIGLAPFEEGEIVDQAVFDDFGIAGAELARRKRVEHLRVDQDHGGLVERADQILAGAAVDRGLAADRAVDLREQGGGNLDEVAAALEDRGREADQVADHAAAQRDDMIAALDAEIEQLVGERFELGPALGRFARRAGRSPRSACRGWPGAWRDARSHSRR